MSHVIYHHVQEALYHILDGKTQAEMGFFPDNITDMSSVVISMTKIVDGVEIDFISPNDANVAIVVGASKQNVIFYNPENATNKTLTVASSDNSKVTVKYDGPLGGGSNATGVTVTGVAVGNATITCTTANNKTATFTVAVT